jgi:Helix-hairpin-helix motif
VKKYQIIIAVLIFSNLHLNAQETEPTNPILEQQLESLTEKQDAETKDDSYWQQLDEFHKNKINLNNATEDDLKELKLVTDLQVNSFFQYRKLFGMLINIYELQAVPNWDVETIKQILPFIKVTDNTSLIENFNKRLHGGEHSFIIRAGEQIEKSKGFEMPVNPASSHYLGSKQALFFRYKYDYKNLLQYGFLGDKDPGEQFFKGAQKYGFDFYSFHLYAKNIGIIKSLAIGDFTVNMGQGLIQWQTIAFTKSAEVMAVTRQSSILRPYNSAGEFNFHRGAGITLQKGKFETTAFVSYKKVSANLVNDTTNREDVISSFESSGYHRTAAEIADRNDLAQTAFGGNISFINSNYRLGINAVQYYFSHAVQKQNEPYNLFSLQGKSWNNLSADYNYTYRNFHLFGEIAVDKNFHNANVFGLQASLNANADVSVVYRNINKQYQSLYSNAFTENTNPTNEKGLYTGISLRPFAGWQIGAYADLYTFSWLKYQVDAPSFGKDYFIQLIYQPNKIWSIYTRFKNEAKQANTSLINSTTHQLALIPNQDWRTEYTLHINKQITIRNRVEILWYDKKALDYEQGFLELVDLFYKPYKKPFAGNMRLQYFETDGYNSRIYVYEDDVLYNYSIPFFYGKGFRYYLNLNFNLKKISRFNNKNKMALEGWIKWSQSIYPSKAIIGSGLDAIQGNIKSDIKFQIFFGW